MPGTQGGSQRLPGGAEGIRTVDLRSAGAPCRLDGGAASGSARLNAADSAPLDRTKFRSAWPPASGVATIDALSIARTVAAGLVTKSLSENIMRDCIVFAT